MIQYKIANLIMILKGDGNSSIFKFRVRDLLTLSGVSSVIDAQAVPVDSEDVLWNLGESVSMSVANNGTITVQFSPAPANGAEGALTFSLLFPGL